jgi:hypothetical protein
MAKVDAVNKLQRFIQKYDRPGSMEKQQLDEALKLLEEAYPGTASRIKRSVEEGSQNERLARELMQETQLGGDIKKGYTVMDFEEIVYKAYSFKFIPFMIFY